MFKDYYAILDIDKSASEADIKSAFKKQALRWHPDRNHGIDTTERMKSINEAYLILKDQEARFRYNVEYERFKKRQRSESVGANGNFHEKHQKTAHDYSTFNVEDDVLRKWMKNASQQAEELAKQALDDIIGISVSSSKAAIKEGTSMILAYLLVGIMAMIFFGVMNTCNK
jgi:DnaJ-class molecular chaperone